MYRLLIVEDEEIIRAGLQKMLDWRSAGFEIAGTAVNGAEALEFLKRCEIDAILADIRMPVMGGLELSAEVRKLYPAIKIILLSAHSEFEYARKALEYGIFGYLLKSDTEEEIERYFYMLKEVLDDESSVNIAAGPGHNEEIYSGCIGNSLDKIGSCDNKKIRDAVAYLKSNFNRDVTLNEVASAVYLHPVHLSRLFSKEIGTTFSDLLTCLRIEKAKELLKGSPMKVYEISDYIGYKKQAYFTAVFKEKAGMTPREFRDAHTT